MSNTPLVPLLDLTDPAIYELVTRSLSATNTEDLINVVHVALRDHAQVEQIAYSLHDDPAASDVFTFDISHPDAPLDRPRGARVTIWSAT